MTWIGIRIWIRIHLFPVRIRIRIKIKWILSTDRKPQTHQLYACLMKPANKDSVDWKKFKQL